MGSSIAARALALLALVVSATAQAAAQQGGTAGVAAAPSQFQAGQQQPGVGAQGIQGAQGAQAPAGFAAMQGAQGAQGAQPPAGFAAMQGVAAPAPGAGTTSNNDILNYLLQLKYLQAAFYSWAAYGRGIPDDLRGGGPVATGGRKGNFTPQMLAFSEELAQVNVAHIRVLRDILGSAAVPQPQLDIGNAFAAAANAALNTQLSPAFDPYANDLFFIHGVYGLQDLIVSAFRGVVPLLNGQDYISVFTGMMGADAYAAGAARWRLADRVAVNTPWGQPVWQVANAFSAWRQKLSGSNLQLDVGILQPLAQSSIALASAPQTFANGNALQILDVDPFTGLVFARTPQQTLGILYGTGDATKPGLFLPRGINGNLKR